MQTKFLPVRHEKILHRPSQEAVPFLLIFENQNENSNWKLRKRNAENSSRCKEETLNFLDFLSLFRDILTIKRTTLLAKHQINKDTSLKTALS